jgi:hypothetical protein
MAMRVLKRAMTWQSSLVATTRSLQEQMSLVGGDVVKPAAMSVQKATRM